MRSAVLSTAVVPDSPRPIVPDEALFVAADEPLLVFPSVGAAENYLEAIDVEDGVYSAAFGPNGERYWITTDGARVFILPIGGPNRPDELKRLLLRYLNAGEIADEPADLSKLASLVWERQFSRTHDEASGKIAVIGFLIFLIFAAFCFYLTFPTL